ncbi:NtrZ family periplasmic regulatory protein [Brevundimonas sp.]|uniref:NtrZ family periplasmic regulatory protein n=2 Tax=unclassified Brevundimonas TaxID=2622653 RepID=UPI00289A7C39|nr:hypothetical protein [Brevundimonas sp.]
MRIGVAGLAIVGALALASVSTDALAQARGSQVGLSQAATAAPSSAERSNLQQSRRGLRWNENGRWGLNLNLNQPVGRGTDWGDVEAGAFYRLNPRLRVGAAANLATRDADPARVEDSDRRSQPRVRLETIFKF